jgi:hypothetical protein
MSYIKTRRRRRNGVSGYLRRTLKRRWQRLAERLPEGVPAAAGFGAILLAGLVLIWRAGAVISWSDGAICTLGITGLMWQGWKWRLRVLNEQRRRQEVLLQSDRRISRRVRGAEEQVERQKRAAMDASAHEGAREAQEARRRAETEQAATEEARRRDREAAIVQEAMRLPTLNETNLQQAAIDAFKERGFEVVRVPNETDCDLLLRGRDGILCAVARRMPPSHRGEAADIQALETWRKEAGSTAAYLIGLAGFTPGAVRLASRLPITLVDAHLLAQWRFAESGSRR